MHPLPLTLGCLLLATVFLDFVWTTMGEGGGPLTRRISAWIWHVVLAVSRRTDGRGLSLAGLLIMLGAIGAWTFALWAGWTLIFSADYSSVISDAGLPADVWERIYYTGFTIFTLGVGDYRANGDIWRILTAVASLTGLFMLTLSVSYLLPVLQAATSKRQFGGHVSTLGETPLEIVANFWNGRNCEALGEHLLELHTSLGRLEQQHIAYPVLHFFHTSNRSDAASLAVARLDEALSILECGFAGDCPLPPPQLRGIRAIIGKFLNTVTDAYPGMPEAPPPSQSLEPLERLRAPAVTQAVFDTRMHSLAQRRRRLLALVEGDGWRWKDVLRGGDPTQSQ